MKCPWCSQPTTAFNNLCPDCYQRANSITSLPSTEFDDLPYGIIELDDSGIIHTFNDTEAHNSGRHAEDVIGLNFFRDVAPCAQVKEYEGRFKELVVSDKPSAELNFVYPFPSGAARVHILMLRTHNNWVLIISKEVA